MPPELSAQRGGIVLVPNTFFSALRLLLGSHNALLKISVNYDDPDIALRTWTAVYK